VDAVFFTEIGKELLQLVERVPIDLKDIEILVKSFQRPGVVVKY